MSIQKKIMLLAFPFFMQTRPGLLLSQGINISSGTHLVANGTVKLVLNNAGFTNNGSFTAGNSTLVYTGNQATASSFIAGTSATSLYNLTLNKSVNGMQLNRDISVANTISFVSGDSLFLNTHIIDLGSTGTLSGESLASRVTGRTGGYLQASATLNAPEAVNPGNLGFEITSTANPGLTTIRRGHQQQSGASVLRYYDVTPANNTGLNAEIGMFYFQQELLSIPEGNLGFFLSTNGGTIWTNLGMTSLNITTDHITLNGVNSFSRFTLSNVSEPLSVKLSRFKGVYQGGVTLLDWVTASEMQSNRFEIERSGDGRHFIRIGTQKAAGNTVLATNYHFTDRNPLPGKNYYRLKEIGLDESYHFSPVIQVNTNPGLAGKMLLFPNPVKAEFLTIQLQVQVAGRHLFRLFNSAGSLVESRRVDLERGSQSFLLAVGNREPGLYYLQVSGSVNESQPVLIR